MVKNYNLYLLNDYIENSQCNKKIDLSILFLILTTYSDEEIKFCIENIDIRNLVHRLSSELRSEISISLFSKIGLAFFSLNYIKKYDNSLTMLYDDIELLFLKHFSEVIRYVQNREVQEKYLDYITGISGSLYCLLISQDLSLSHHDELINEALLYLKNSVNDILTTSKNIKLGSAHGLSGIMFVLTFAYIKGCHIEGQIAVIDKIWNMLFSTKQIFEDIFYWSYDLSTISSISIRASWCVGNLGILNNLLFVAKHLSKKEYEQIRRSVHNLVESDFQALQYSDNSICHGYTGYFLFLSFLEREKIISTQVHNYKLQNNLTMLDLYNRINLPKDSLTVTYFFEQELGIYLAINTLLNKRSSIYDLLGFI